jgi:hypothetical protein
MDESSLAIVVAMIELDVFGDKQARAIWEHSLVHTRIA